MPKNKQQSKQWIKSGEAPPKKTKTILFANKVMIFGILKELSLLITLRRIEPSMVYIYYAGLLQRLSDEVKKKRPHLAKKRSLFHHDNAPEFVSYCDG